LSNIITHLEYPFIWVTASPPRSAFEAMMNMWCI
jgi:hypothetical protein